MGCLWIKVAGLVDGTSKDLKQVTDAVSIGVHQTVTATNADGIQLVPIAIAVALRHGVSHFDTDNFGDAVSSVISGRVNQVQGV